MVGGASHVALSQDLVDRQQAGDLLDDDLPGQLEGPAAGVRPFSLGLKAAGFLTDRRTDGRKKETERERDGRTEGTEHHLIKSGDGSGAHHHVHESVGVNATAQRNSQQGPQACPRGGAAASSST